MEVLAGIRPIHQLARRLDPRCLAALQHRAALIRREITRTGNPALARLHRNSAVRSVRVCEISDGIYEASAVVVDDVRARAVAVRLERSNLVWGVTDVVMGLMVRDRGRAGNTVPGPAKTTVSPSAAGSSALGQRRFFFAGRLAASCAAALAGLPDLPEERVSTRVCVPPLSLGAVYCSWAGFSGASSPAA